MSYPAPLEDWPADAEPRPCRRWNRKRKVWQWKTRFETRKEAAERAGKGMALYVCDHCGFWHRGRAPVPPSEKQEIPE